MKRILALYVTILSVFNMYADKDVKFYMNNGEIKCIAQQRIDSIMFDEQQDVISVVFENRCETIPMSLLDSIKYGNLPSGVSVTYLDTCAVVENPFAFDSIAVSIDRAKVVVKSYTTQEVDYILQGRSDDGGFKIYGVKKYNLHLNGVELANSAGAPINSQCKKRMRVFLLDGTSNTLSDASAYQVSGNEDEKGTLFSEGQIIFEGNGSLSLNGNSKHAICSDDYIEVRSGNITVVSALSDAVHANDSVIVSGGSLSLNAVRDGIDCDGSVKLLDGTVSVSATGDDVKGIKSGGNILFGGADVKITVPGNASKGVKSAGCMNIESGSITVEATGNALVVDGDPSYATCLKCDSIINVSGGTIVLNATGVAGRGMSADVDVNIKGGNSAITCSGDSGIYDPSLSESGATDTEEEKNSYVVYVSIPTSTSGNRPGSSSSAWKSVYLYNSSNMLVATLANSVAINGTLFYYYDFGSEVTDSYYFKSDDYSSSRGSYTIQSSIFAGLDSDRYYQISSSYSTSGTVRTYSLNDVTPNYEGGSVSSGSATEASYKAAGIKCDGNLLMQGGIHMIKMTGTESKGIKVDNEARFSGGSLTIETSGTAKIVAYDPSYCTAIKCDGALTIDGGEIDITATGQGGMGISADGVLTLDGGNVNIVISGAGSSYTAATGTDYYSTKCLKGDVAVQILSGTLDCTAKGNGSKAIVATGLLTIGKEGASDDNLTVKAVTEGTSLGASSGSNGGWGGGMGGGMQEGFNAAPKAIKGASNVVVNSGNIYAETKNDGGEGLESKAVMTINGGSIECNTYDDGINAASSLVFNGGYVYSHASNNDGIDSNGTIAVNGGVVLSSGTNAPEEGFDCDQNQFAINGGVLIGTGGATSSPTSATQPYSQVSSVAIAQGKYIAVKDGSGNVLFAYKCPNGVNSATLLLSSPGFKASSSYTLMYGVTSVSGASETHFNDVFLVGGTLSGGSSKSFTPSTR